MALLEEEGDEGLHDDLLLAALDAEEKRRLGLQQQQRHQGQHHRPPLSYSTPQKKLALSHLSSSSGLENLKPPTPPPAAPPHHNSVGLKIAKAPQVSLNYQQSCQSSHHREARALPPGGKKLMHAGFATNVVGACHWNAHGAPDVKPITSGYLKTEDSSVCGGAVGGGGGGGGGGGQWKQEEFLKNGSATAAATAVWNGRRPLQELTPWVGSHETAAERPSSASVWLPPEKTSCSVKESNGNAAWFSGLSGVAMFKECQDAAMLTLLPSDYTILHGKKFIKKTGWRKIAFFFNISFEIKDKKIQFDSQANVLRAEFTIRATMLTCWELENTDQTAVYDTSLEMQDLWTGLRRADALMLSPQQSRWLSII